MWLLSASIVLFIIIVGLIIYGNMPVRATFAGGCGCGGRGCGNCPCNRCGMPKRRCGCQGPPQGGCPFC